jgi:hypothetical protein
VKRLKGIMSTGTLCNTKSGVCPLLESDSRLCHLAAALKAKGQNIVSIICGHMRMPWSRRVLADSVNILFLFSIV